MYFDQFPSIAYGNAGNLDENVRKVAKDIVRRVAFDAKVKEEISIYETYIVENDDTPDIVADKVYGDPQYHWVVLLFNDIVNPFYDWPLGDQTIENYIEKKYPGKVLYLSSATVTDGVLTGTGDWIGATFASDETIFLWSGTADNIGNIYNYNTKGLVWDFDPTKSALVVVNEVGNSEFRVGDVIVKIDDSDNETFAYVERIVVNQFALHHFETRDGISGDANWLDPLSSSEGIPLGQTGAGPIGGFATVGGTGSGSNIATPVSIDETWIGRYIGIAGATPNNTNVVTNREYELDLNESRRRIRLIHPRYLQDVVDQFTSKINTSPGRTIFDSQFRRLPSR